MENVLTTENINNLLHYCILYVILRYYPYAKFTFIVANIWLAVNVQVHENKTTVNSGYSEVEGTEENTLL